MKRSAPMDEPMKDPSNPMYLPDGQDEIREIWNVAGWTTKHKTSDCYVFGLPVRCDPPRTYVQACEKFEKNTGGLSEFLESEPSMRSTESHDLSDDEDPKRSDAADDGSKGSDIVDLQSTLFDQVCGDSGLRSLRGSSGFCRMCRM